MPGEDALKTILPNGWERSETSEGIPYYVHHDEQCTQWTHPILQDLFKELKCINKIKYGAYRTASKLRRLQTIINMHMVNGQWLTDVLDEIGLRNLNNFLFVAEVETLLSKLFSRVSEDINVEQSMELSLNWILSCYDSGRTGRVLLRSLMTGIILISAMTPLNRYKGLYAILSANAEDKVVTGKDLAVLLNDILMLIEYVGEEKTFDSKDISGAVISCQKLNNNDASITENGFVKWMKKEPQLLVWLHTLHRLVTAETIKHEAKCVVCKAYPITGFRYRCLKCFNTDLCQSCYWSQNGTRTHKLSHPVREYCLATTSTDDFKDFTSQLNNKITRKYQRRGLKKMYLSNEENSETEDIALCTDTQVHQRVIDLASRLEEERVEKPIVVVKDVSHLEDEKRQYLSKIANLEEENKVLMEKINRNVKSTNTSASKLMTPIVSISSIEPAKLTLAPVSTTSVTGLSASSTLDEFVQGNEEESLHYLTTLLVNTLSLDATPVKVSNTELLTAAHEIDSKMEGFVNDVKHSLKL